MEPLKNLRILVSLSNTKGIITFIRQLQETFPVEIVATPGTKKHLVEAGFRVTPVEKLTGKATLFDGRIKMIHLPIFAAILADQRNPAHIRQLRQLIIEPFNMVVVNFYPFEKVVKSEKSNIAKIIENIDIGGPAAIRAAAKNFYSVIPICDPQDYSWLINSFKKQKNLSLKQRKKLAQKVFILTKEFDNIVAKYLKST